MKNILLGAVCALTIAVPTNAGLWNTFSTRDWDSKTSTHYTVDTLGYDVRVYEWTPEYSERVRCVFLAGSSDNGTSGIACYEATVNQ